ncbi:carboxymuconolactone decarboxylase family protein [Streptomyces sp. E11-3]|uniref:carboxymuconolactone decarboxylase family protein n=1 Tax=Streptomyces sp. E11-3 TaxID=3110112 RepID=UPI0039801AA0
MARISLAPRPSLVYRFVRWYSKRAYGRTMDPLKAMAHHPKALWGTVRYEQSIARWNTLDHELKALAVMASAAAIGCSWCMDFGYWKHHESGMDPRKLEDVPVWRESAVYTPLERDVLEYAEAVTTDPYALDDSLADRLIGRLGEEAFVELTMMVAVENLRSRFNAAVGLTSQGFKESCALPRTGSERTPTSS